MDSSWRVLLCIIFLYILPASSNNSTELNTLTSSSNVTITFKSTIGKVEDRTKVLDAGYTKVFTWNQTESWNSSLGSLNFTLDRKSGYYVRFFIDQISMNPEYVDTVRSGDVENQVRNNTADYASILASKCRYPLPVKYNVNTVKKYGVSGIGYINCSDPYFYNTSYFQCSTSNKAPYRLVNSSCCSMSPTCYNDMSYFLEPNRVVCTERKQFLNTTNQCEALRALLDNCTRVNNASSTACTTQRNNYYQCLYSTCKIMNSTEISLSPVYSTTPTEYDCDIEFKPKSMYRISFQLYDGNEPMGTEISYLVNASNAAELSTSILVLNKGVQLISSLSFNTSNPILDNFLLRYRQVVNESDTYRVYKYQNKTIDFVSMSDFNLLTFKGPTSISLAKNYSVPSFPSDDIPGVAGDFKQTAGPSQTIIAGDKNRADMIKYFTNSSIAYANFEAYGYSYDCTIPKSEYPVFTTDATYMQDVAPTSNNYEYSVENFDTTFQSKIFTSYSVFSLVYERAKIDPDSIVMGVSNNLTERVWYISYNSSITSCNITGNNTHYVTLGMREDGSVTLANYDIVFHSACVLNFVFTVPFNNDENYIVDNSNTTLNYTRSLTIVLEDKLGAYAIRPDLKNFDYGTVDDSYYHTEPYELSSTDLRVAIAVCSGIFVTFILWIMLCVYSYHVKDKKIGYRSSDLDRRKQPIKWLCWRIQEMLPKSKSKSSNTFRIKKNVFFVIFVIFAGVIRAVTFTFTAFILVFLALNYQHMETLKEVPDSYYSYSGFISNTSVKINDYRTEEIDRQNAEMQAQIDVCNTELAALEGEFRTNRSTMMNQNYKKMNDCDVDRIMNAIIEAQKQLWLNTMNDYKTQVKDYVSTCNSQLNTYRRYYELAQPIVGVLCDWFCEDVAQLRNPDGPADPNQPDDIVIKTEPAEVVQPEKDSRDYDLQFADINFNGPSIDVDVPSFKIDLTGLISFNAFISIVGILDIILIIKKIFRVLGRAGQVVKGETIEEEANVKIFDAQHKQQNYLKDEKVWGDIGSKCSDACFACIAWINSRLMYLINRWPMIMYSIQKIFLLAFILLLFAGLIVLILAILTPGFAEAVPIAAMMVSPARVNMQVTNQMIVYNAYKINSQKTQIAKEDASKRLIQLGKDLNRFNAEEATRLNVFNAQLKSLRLVSPNKSAVCDDLVFTPLVMSYNVSTYECEFDSVEARIYQDFKPNLLESEINSDLTTYILALRNFIINTLALIGIIIGFFVLSGIFDAVTWRLLVHFKAVRINRVFWYISRFEEDFPEDANLSTMAEMELQNINSPTLAAEFAGAMIALSAVRELITNDRKKINENDDPKKINQEELDLVEAFGRRIRLDLMKYVREHFPTEPYSRLDDLLALIQIIERTKTRELTVWVKKLKDVEELLIDMMKHYQRLEKSQTALPTSPPKNAILLEEK